MGTFTLGTPILLANGYQMTFNVAAGTCNGTVTTDPTKISIALTSEGFNSSGVLGTLARTITIVSATVSGSTLTCNLSEPIYNDDTSVSVTLQAAAFTDVTPDTSDALGSTSVDIATTPSTLDYALHSGIHFIDPPHQRYTGTTFDLRALGLHQYGWAACKMGITRCLTITTTAAGITGTFTYPEAITFVGSGATGVLAPGSDLTGAGSAKTIRVFVRSGTPVATDVITGGSSGATAIHESATGGGETSGFATFTTRDRDGSYGPATKQDVWKYTVTPPAVDRYERWMIWYPTIGDTSWDSRSLSVRATAGVMTGDSCRGDWEISCDPGDTQASLQKSYYVDRSSSAACPAAGAGSISGTFGRREFCLVSTLGTPVAVVRAVGSAAGGTQTTGATSFRYNGLPNSTSVKTITIGTLVGGTPAYGHIMVRDQQFGSTTTSGYVLAYDGGTGTLTYLVTSSTDFATGQNVKFLTNNAVATGITAATTANPSAALGTTVTNGDTILGLSTGATCTLSGSPVANGSDTTGNGTSGNPFATIMKGMKQASTDRGDGLCDGAMIYCLAGCHAQEYTGAYEAESRDHWLTITHAPGLTYDDVEITKWTNSAGLATNFQRYYDVTVFNWSSSSGVNVVTTNATITGNYDRPAIWFDSCRVDSFFRWALGQINQFGTGATQPYYVACTNCYITRTVVVAHLYRDVTYDYTANDTFTLGRGIFNVETSYQDAVDASTLTYHCDVFQMQGTENGNLLIWGLTAKNIGYCQAAPFMNSSAGTTSVNSCGFVNMLQGEDGTASGAQVGNTTAASTLTLSAWTWVDCSLADDWRWRASAAGRNTTLVNLRSSSSVWLNTDDTDSGTISGIYPGSYRNNHFVTAPDSGTYNTYSDTTTTTLANLFVSVTDTDAGFLVPKAASVALDRDLASTRPSGWPTLDVYGRLRSTDAAAQGAIGAAQPFPTLTVTYDGDSVSDGGTVTSTTGTKNLVMSAATGPTGSVVYISTVSITGSSSGVDGAPYTLTSGGATDDDTIAVNQTPGSGAIDITWDLSSTFDFDITGSSGASGARFRDRTRDR